MSKAGSIFQLIHNRSAVWARECDQILQEQLGIGFAQYKILDSVYAGNSGKQRELAVITGQTEAGVSRQIGLLRSQGMLLTRANPVNRREHRMRLTTKGERMLEAARQIIAKYQQDKLMALNGKQEAVLVELLRLL